MNKLLPLLLVVILMCGCTGDNTEYIIPVHDNIYSCTYEGAVHELVIDLPEKTKGAPLAVMLHGYGDTAQGFRSTVHFEEKANPLGYAVVYVQGAPDPDDATSAAGWNSGLGSGGNDDTAFLVWLAKRLCEKYSFDKKRVFAVGFSNGAFMTHRLAMESDGTYSAFVSVAGMCPERTWNERPEAAAVNFMQITGEKDDVVPKNSDGSAKYSKAPAIEDVMQYRIDSAGAEFSETAILGKGSVLNKYSGGDLSVWDIFVKDGRHSWPTVKNNGFDANDIIIEFLEGLK